MVNISIKFIKCRVCRCSMPRSGGQPGAGERKQRARFDAHCHVIGANNSKSRLQNRAGVSILNYLIPSARIINISSFVPCRIQALIEREWIQAGFPFGTRHKQSCYTPSANRSKNSGSTFVLFLDCIHQLHCQFPLSFEFGIQMLMLIFEHSFFSQYGTFLGDCERERKSIKLHERTTSLWSYLNRPDVLKSLLNPTYEPNPAVIWPSIAPISLEIWTGKTEHMPKSSKRNSFSQLVLFFRIVLALGHRSEPSENYVQPNPNAGNPRKGVTE